MIGVSRVAYLLPWVLLLIRPLRHNHRPPGATRPGRRWSQCSAARWRCAGRSPGRDGGI